MGFRDIFRPKPSVTVDLEVQYPSSEQIDAMRAEARERYHRNKDVIDDYVKRTYGDDPFEQMKPPTAEICPHCGCVYAAPLARSRKCPVCGEKIVLRTVEGKKYALTPDQAEFVDNRKKLLAEYRAAFRRVELVGYGANDFVSALESRGPGYSARDASWGLLNQRALDAMNAGDFQGLKMAYLQQAVQLRDEGRDPIQSLALCREAETLEYRNSDIAKGLVITACDCAQCRKDQGRKLSWDQLERGRFGLVGPLPHADCEKGFCTCLYAAWTKSWEELGFKGIPG